MQESITPREQESIKLDSLDELDYSIIHCLQIWPRAPWAMLEKVLGVDAVTVGRRWAKISEKGLAWISTYPMTKDFQNWGFVSALIEVRVAPHSLDLLISALQKLPMVSTIRFMLSDWNLSMDTRHKGMARLEEFLSHTLGSFPGVQSVRTSIVAEALIEGSTWRINALSQAQIEQLELLQGWSLERSDLPPGLHDIDIEIANALYRDGRKSMQKVADELNSSVNTVRKHFNHLVESKHLLIRCDMSRQISGWPMTVRFLGSIPIQSKTEIIQQLRRISEIRSCSVLIGPNNIMLNVWLRSFSDIGRFESYLVKFVPDLVIRDRSVISSFRKLMWRNLYPNGRCMPDEMQEPLMPPEILSGME